MSGSEVTGTVKRGVPMLAAGLLRPGQHEMRVPGRPEWLPVQRTRRTGVGLLVTAGGREFLTGSLVKWPARPQLVEP